MNAKRGYICFHYFLNQDSPSDVCLDDPIFVTQAEKNYHDDISSKTIANIDSIMIDLIEQIDDDGMRMHYLTSCKKILTKKKDDHLILLMEIKSVVENQVQFEVVYDDF